VGATWLEQAVYYTVMDMVRVFFPAREDGAAPGPRHFFARPPLGFAIVAFTWQVYSGVFPSLTT
jgi:hypothetical protein